MQVQHVRDERRLSHMSYVVTDVDGDHNSGCSQPCLVLRRAGQADVYPATSGKEQAARYLIQQLGADTANCSLLCDDDNDLSALLFPSTLINPTAEA